MKSLALFLILLMIWGVGLLAFTARVERSTPAPAPPVADGIVVLTGASTARMREAMQLLEEHKAGRMLISGVNREATRSDVRTAAKATDPLYDCCVDLGFQAVDTVGNARETAEWAKAHDFHKLIVVTADYHMPRSLLEIRSALPKATLIAYPVATDELNARRWWTSGHGARRMVVEYCKFLVILAREGLGGLGRRDHAAPAAAKPPKEARP